MMEETTSAVAHSLVIRPRRPRPLHPVSFATVSAGESVWSGGPRLGLAEPEEQKRRLLAGGFVAFGHAAILALMFAIAALAPPEFVESVIPVALIPMPKAIPEVAPLELPGSNAEPAPAGPKQVGAQRANAAALASAQSLTPTQAAALRRDALDAAARAIEPVNVESAAVPSLPTEITRRDVQAETVTARAAAALAPTQAVDVRAVAPVKIDAAQLAATPRDLAGPRAIDPASLTDLSTRDALAGLDSAADSDTARFDGSVTAGSLATTGAVSGSTTGSRVAVGIDTGVSGAWASAGGSSGAGSASGSGSGTAGNDAAGGAGTGGTGDSVGTLRCLESPAVQRYLERVQQRTSQRWRVPADVPDDTAVVLRFELDAAGMANHVESRSEASDASVLANSARQALLSAAPFAPLDASSRCLTDKRIVLTFTVPTR